MLLEQASFAHPALGPFVHLSGVGQKDDTLAGTETADIDLLVIALRNLLQEVVLVPLGLEVEFHLRPPECAEVTLHVERISVSTEHESGHERGI